MHSEASLPRQWEGLHESLLALTEEQLERTSALAELETNSQKWQGTIRTTASQGLDSNESERFFQSSVANAAPREVADPEAIASFVRFFSMQGRDHFQVSLARLAQYRPMIERIFAEEGVPPEMLWVGLVESGYNPHARSPKNAVGIWQLIPETAARYGLSTRVHDGRIDPERSTRAAARYLRFLYNSFGDWMLALAAYNAGENRVGAAIERAGSRDFWWLAQKGFLPRETRDYVPAVMAAKLLGEKSTIAGASLGIMEKTSADRLVFAPFSLSVPAGEIEDRR